MAELINAGSSVADLEALVATAEIERDVALQALELCRQELELARQEQAGCAGQGAELEACRQELEGLREAMMIERELAASEKRQLEQAVEEKVAAEQLVEVFRQVEEVQQVHIWGSTAGRFAVDGRQYT